MEHIPEDWESKGVAGVPIVPNPIVVGGSRWETPLRNTRTHRSCSDWNIAHKIRGLHSSQITNELFPLLARQLHLLTGVGMDHSHQLLAFLVFLFLLKSCFFFSLVFHTLLFLVLLELPL